MQIVQRSVVPAPVLSDERSGGCSPGVPRSCWTATAVVSRSPRAARSGGHWPPNRLPDERIGQSGEVAMPEEEKLKLGKGAAFVKSRLKRLPLADETWEADFRALPKPIEQTQTHYLGMVVSGKDGWLLAETTVHGRPSVNDLATILAHAMRRPLDGDARRPRLVHLRGHHQWRELFPHLEEIGIGV